jgi:DNA polymerase sigma
MEEHPFLAPLTIVFKKFIVLNGYNSPFQGTLSSYSLVLMILAMLKDIRKRHDGNNFELIGG